MASVDDRGHLAHRVDRAIGVALHRRGIVHHLRLVRRADFLEHPAGDSPACLRIGVEDEVARHRLSPDSISEHSENELRSEEHTSELRSLMSISYAVFCL